MSNSYLFVFYSEHVHKEIRGHVTNWNNTGYSEVCMICVSRGYNVSKISVVISLGHVMFNDHKSLYINDRFYVC